MCQDTEAMGVEFRPDPEMFVCMDPTGCYHVSWNEEQHRAKAAQVAAIGEARYVMAGAPAVDGLEVVAYLRSDAAQLLRMSKAAEFGKDLSVRVADPSLLISNMVAAADALSTLSTQVHRLTAEVARCHARLEIDRVYVGTDEATFEEQAVPMNERVAMPDGIEARDATIQLLEADAKRVTEENEALRKERNELVYLMGEVDQGNAIQEARIKDLEEALTDAQTWHEEQDKSLSKQPPTNGPTGNQWARLQHREQIDMLSAALSQGGGE